MAEGQAKAFLDYLRDKSDERAGLQNAVVEEIIAAGAEAGFVFTSRELHDAIGKQDPPPLKVENWSHAAE